MKLVVDKLEVAEPIAEVITPRMKILALSEHSYFTAGCSFCSTDP